MVLWILALLLVGAVAAVGSYQGAVRAGFSLAGLLMGALLAMPLGQLLRPLLVMCGVHHPLLLDFLGPIVAFVLLLMIFKIAGFIAHRKFESYFKYRTSDTQRMLWERLNQRLGLCVGAANGLVYVLGLSVLVYSLGYATVQLATSEQDSAGYRMLNTVSQDLQRTGMIKAISPFTPLTAVYYDAADILGLVFHNPLIQNRLSRYPSLVTLAEAPEFQAVGKDVGFQQTWASQPALGDFLGNEKIKAIVGNSELYSNVLAVAAGDLPDLKEYLVTGKSGKYDEERILGRWDFDARATISLARKKPNVTTVELNKLRRAVSGSMSKATLTATIDKRAILKTAKSSAEGTWKNDGLSQYKVTLKEGDRKREATVLIESNRLLLLREGFQWVFEK